MATKSLVWFRNDLRLRDNPALSASAAEGAVEAVYVLCPQQWDRQGYGDAKRGFLLTAVKSLHAVLAERRVRLHVLELGPTMDVAAEVVALARRSGCQGIHANEEVGLYEQERDQDLGRRCAAFGIEATFHHDQTLLPWSELRSPLGQPYRVFTPFWRNLRTKLETLRPAVLEVPELSGVGPIVPLPDSIERAQSEWDASPSGAQQMVRSFLEHVDEYPASRNRVDLDGTSRISPYLSAGLISPRECAQMSLESGGPGAEAWLRELGWRDFYRHIAWENPHVLNGEPFQAETASLRFDANEERFRAWCEGRTGYPIVDAAMRCLVQTGWLHNRLRMVVAMFLTKDLWMDWREGERFFMRHLADADFCNNNGGWQWCASTGVDASPYFRVFNPILQGKKADPDGDFVRRWVPELRGVTSLSVHDPTPLERKMSSYPEPIVDHAAARQRAIAEFKALGHSSGGFSAGVQCPPTVGA